ncbi:MAG: hypothetical protein H6738_17015 [Alphaproteobacteria bacterium]|nr:hypothetical protein [Alphaproteobacteria bacterium]MCB9698485.1 hypothetical protein [Alphaproteobacteria bacterium]
MGGGSRHALWLGRLALWVTLVAFAAVLELDTLFIDGPIPLSRMPGWLHPAFQSAVLGLTTGVIAGLGAVMWARRVGLVSRSGLLAPAIALTAVPNVFWLYYELYVLPRELVGRRLRGAPAVPSTGWWSSIAQDELDAAAAFDRLGEELRAHGAPDALVRRCLTAADEERVHAELAASLAGAAPVSRTCLRPLPTLATLAVESLGDGVRGEGAASRALLEEAALADGAERSVLLRIGEEEREHAVLAEDVLAWCLAVGGDEVAEAVRRTRLVVGAWRPLRTRALRATVQAWRHARAVQRSAGDASRITARGGGPRPGPWAGSAPGCRRPRRAPV